MLGRSYLFGIWYIGIPRKRAKLGQFLKMKSKSWFQLDVNRHDRQQGHERVFLYFPIMGLVVSLIDEQRLPTWLVSYIK